MMQSVVLLSLVYLITDKHIVRLLLPTVATGIKCVELTHHFK